MQRQEKLSWILITLSLSFPLSLQYVSVNHRKEKEIDQEQESKGGKANGSRWSILELWTILYSLLELFGPRNRVVLDCGKLDYTTLSCPINYPPVWGINPSYLPMPSLWNYSPFSDGWRVSNPALENIGEQMKRPPPTPTQSNQKGLFHIQLKLYRINYQAWIRLSYC